MTVHTIIPVNSILLLWLPQVNIELYYIFEDNFVITTVLLKLGAVATLPGAVIYLFYLNYFLKAIIKKKIDKKVWEALIYKTK